MSSHPSTAQGLVNQRECVAVAAALTSLSVIIVTLRVYTRAVIVRNFGHDDYAMLVALVLIIGYFVAIIVLKDNGLGLSGEVLSPTQMRNQVQTTLAIQVIYYVVINTIKISILFFYLRIAARKRLEALSKGTIGFLAAFCSICIICTLSQCIPLHKFWDLTGTAPGTCSIDATALFYATSSINIAIDIWILVLPITTLLKVQRPTREKAALVGIFSLGVFSTIASIVRLHAIHIYTESSDPFFDSVPINLWSMVEVNVGILCASIPSLKALFSSSQRQRSKNGAGYQYHSRGKSGVQDDTAESESVRLHDVHHAPTSET
ncbi:hypothetical protein HBI56_151920 [Parastagonospora nodorum]|nr:hypothetical protein HBH42_202460 [Parastagonospora nodorum]KAH4343673.1 hypothetical protein HBH98_145480 [Parastagonospora nodorum]KAH4371185.1 hypothetical protein HBH97_137860 [Parastagonospora nodorum]KAH4394169.1 hypothetical protein HBH99_141220 [Parastagonospora nodorum]KAH4981183.1 hypothetical protein HBI76_174580 [Parastagonospora nodorum]